LNSKSPFEPGGKSIKNWFDADGAALTTLINERNFDHWPTGALDTSILVEPNVTVLLEFLNRMISLPPAIEIQLDGL
jgi:hypothetical protein